MGYAAPCSTFAVTSDGNSLISSHRDKHVIIWNLLTKTKTANFELDEEIDAVHYLAKNKVPYLVLFGDKGIPRILNINTQEIVFIAEQPPQPFLRCIYVKATNSLLAVTTEQNVVIYKIEFDEESVPKLVHDRDCIGFNDEILDTAYDQPNGRIIVATNSTLLK